MKNTKRILLGCCTPILALGFTACTGGGSSGLGDALNVSGVLSLGNTSQGVVKAQAFSKLEDSVSASSVNLGLYKVSCSTTTTPVKTATANVKSDGSFTVSIEGATGQPL